MGYDIDLFVAVADKLGFTFEIHETPMLDGETYTQYLLRTVDSADLWLCWWLRSRERMDAASMLFGHVDASPVLVAPPPTTDDGPPPMDTFFKPFSYPLWGCIIAMIFFSGVCDFLLEWGHGGTLSSSIYECTRCRRHPSCRAFRTSAWQRTPPRSARPCTYALVRARPRVQILAESCGAASKIRTLASRPSSKSSTPPSS